MSRESRILGACPNCGGSQFACSYNHFEKDDLAIHSWEHKCPDCGFRDTKAFRSDDQDQEPGQEAEDPRRCPFCSRQPGA